jgi:hypothetical protein
MSNESSHDETRSSPSGQAPGPLPLTASGASAPTPRDLLQLPALAAIALYMLFLAGVIVFGVVSGRHYPSIFLVFSALFIAASGGLLMLFRWAWAMTLAAVLLLAGYNMWIAVALHQPAAIVQSLLNLVFFLYLIRTEVREKLR